MIRTASDKLIFVYGTLRLGDPSKKCDLMRRNGGVIVCRTSITGTLIDLGAYPALLDRGDGKVHGELWSVPHRAIYALDSYEGYAYTRITVKTAEGVEAYAYVLNEAEVDASKFPVIKSGDWFNRNRIGEAANRGDAILSAWRKMGGVGDASACVADILAAVYIEDCVAEAEARAEGEHYNRTDVCEEAQATLEALVDEANAESMREIYGE